MDESGHTLRYVFEGEVSSLQNATQRAISAISRYGDTVTRSFDLIGSVTKRVTKAFSALAGVGISDILASGARASIDYTESLNLFQVALGDAAGEANEFVQSMSSVYGMDPKSVMDTAGTFYLLSDALGVSSDASRTMSLNLTKAANDIASLYNADVATVADNLQSGLVGMSRAVRKYGYDITQATLSQYALQYGLSGSVSTMSEVNKRALRYLALMDQMYKATQQEANAVGHTGEIFGDFANTIEQPANQLRIFKEQIAMLGRAIGDWLITSVASAMHYINGFVMALRMAISFVGSLLGILSVFERSSDTVTTGAEDAAETIGNIGGSAGKAAKELKKLIAPFDELTLLNKENESASGGGGSAGSSDVLDPALAAAIEQTQLGLENIRMKALDVRDAILTWLGFSVGDDSILGWDGKVLAANLGEATGFVQTFGAIYEHWEDISQGFQDVWAGIVAVLDQMTLKVREFIEVTADPTAASFFETLGPGLSSFGEWLTEHSDQIATAVLSFAALFAVLRTAAAIAVLVTPLVTILGTLGKAVLVLVGSVPLIAGLVAALALVIATIIDLWNTDAEFKTDVQSTWDHLAQAISDIWTGILQPVISEVWNLLVSLYESVIKPVIAGAINIILQLVDVISLVVSFIVSSVGPVIVQVVQWISQVLQSIFEWFHYAIDGVVQLCSGLITFLSGVFTGDFSKVWEGLVQIVEGISNILVGIVLAVVNGLIGLVNGAIALIWGYLAGFINDVLSVINSAGALFGKSWNLSVDASSPPQISYLTAMAAGGYVQGPTQALIGEAGREAVLPLDRNTEWADIVADRIAEAMGSGTKDSDLSVYVYLDGKQISDVVTKYQRRASRAGG